MYYSYFCCSPIFRVTTTPPANLRKYLPHFLVIGWCKIRFGK